MHAALKFFQRSSWVELKCHEEQGLLLEPAIADMYGD